MKEVYAEEIHEIERGRALAQRGSRFVKVRMRAARRAASRRKAREAEDASKAGAANGKEPPQAPSSPPAEGDNDKTP